MWFHVCIPSFLALYPPFDKGGRGGIFTFVKSHGETIIKPFYCKARSVVDMFSGTIITVCNAFEFGSELMLRGLPRRASNIRKLIRGI
jgi:hypothetical protein